MSERWLGVAVSSNAVTLVDAEVDGAAPLVVQMDDTWSLQEGGRAEAYRVIHQRLVDYARENKIVKSVIKASAVSLKGTKKVHLDAAELRGVVMGALASVTVVELQSKAHISRNFGSRKVDEYLKDNAFWTKEVAGGDLRIGSREAAMVLIAAR